MPQHHTAHVSGTFAPFEELPLVIKTDHRTMLIGLANVLGAIEQQIRALPVLANRRIDLPTVEALPPIREARKRLMLAARACQEIAQGGDT